MSELFTLEDEIKSTIKLLKEKLAMGTYLERSEIKFYEAELEANVSQLKLMQEKVNCHGY